MKKTKHLIKRGNKKKKRKRKVGGENEAIIPKTERK